jgi:hypothetical protein
MLWIILLVMACTLETAVLAAPTDAAGPYVRAELAIQQKCGFPLRNCTVDFKTPKTAFTVGSLTANSSPSEGIKIAADRATLKINISIDPGKATKLLQGEDYPAVIGKPAPKGYVSLDIRENGASVDEPFGDVYIDRLELQGHRIVYLYARIAEFVNGKAVVLALIQYQYTG